MHFRYDLTFGIQRPPSAYEWLLHDAMQGNQTLFTRSDWLYEAWAIVDPVLKYWETKAVQELPLYAAGTWGPNSGTGAASARRTGLAYWLGQASFTG